MYTPMALETARALAPDLFVYDVMDDLAAFRFAPEGLVLRRRHALRDADIVFTGGRSLYRGVMEARAGAVYCFPSGVEPDHYAPAREWRAQQDDARRRVAGYVGVIDERVDLDLVAGLAEELDDWEVRMVGPLAKLSEADLPRAGNLTYPGPASYAELPRVMAGFDVALMPFALNEATRSISPTKTLEYLAAGLPVVSTRVPDVVGDHSAIVQFADNAAGFAVACRRSVAGLSASDLEQVRAVLQLNRWDAIAARMGTLLDEASGDERLAVRESA
jgi:glycosyltransferase involved in cell wall biosynthesis